MKDLYDCSAFKTGDRVRSLLYEIEGMVTILNIQPPNVDSYQLIEVAWENGKVSHPYPDQIEKLEIGAELPEPDRQLELLQLLDD